MEIELHEVAQKSIEDFADENGLVMEVHERSPKHMGNRWHEGARYYAHFKGCEIKESVADAFLVGAFGDGATPEEAISNYAKEISEKLLVVNAGREDRRNIPIPWLS